MKLILALLVLLLPACYAADILYDGGNVYVNGVSTNNAAAYATWLAQQPVPRHNPAFDRYWWLYGICQRYGLSLPCDIAALRVAMYQATTTDNAAGIALDAVDAVTCFFANGGTSADWSQPPPELLP